MSNNLICQHRSDEINLIRASLMVQHPVYRDLHFAGVLRCRHYRFALLVR